MVTKMADKKKLKIEKSPFLAKFEAFGDRFFKNLKSAQANTKKTFNILCALINLIIC